MPNDRSPLDLKNAVPGEVLENLGRRGRYFLEIGGLLHEMYHNDDLFMGDRLSNRLRAEMSWFENLVQHAPTVGTFYESLLRTVLREMKPARLSIGTGFVYDPEQRTTSSQLDIVIYDDTERAALYKTQEFVVLCRESVVALAEVKKTLTLEDLRNVVRRTLNCRLGTNATKPTGVQFINIFAYKSKCKTVAIVDCLQSELSHFLQTFTSQAASGQHVHFAATHISLPRVYFFDRGDVVEADIKAIPGGRTFRFSVSVLAAARGDGASEFMQDMLHSGELDRGPNLEPDLHTIPIREIKTSLDIPGEFLLTTKISMNELALRFPKDRQELVGVRIGGKRPYAVLVPASLDWHSISTLDALRSASLITWLTVEDAGDHSQPGEPANAKVEC